jgi:hypothetical protein
MDGRIVDRTVMGMVARMVAGWFSDCLKGWMTGPLYEWWSAGWWQVMWIVDRMVDRTVM